MGDDSVSKNLNTMRRAVKAFSEGDGATLSEVFSSDAVWHVPGRSVLAGTYTGQAEVFRFFGELMARTDGTFRIEPLDMYANETGGVFTDRIKAEREGRSLDVRLLLEVKIVNGQIVEGFDHFHQEHIWDEFWT